jgi:2-oxoglutarate ferredoxin oxidoreductase subunit alpha
MKKNTDSISIVLCGQAGQGIQTVESILTKIMSSAGYNVFATKEYMSRVRGGMNSTQIRISGKPVSAFLKRIDILVPLDKGAINHLGDRVSAETIIIGEKNVCCDEIQEDKRFFDIPFTKIATSLGNKVFSNTVAVGALASLLAIEQQAISGFLAKFFSGKPKEIIDKNIEAAEKGYQKAAELPISFQIQAPKKAKPTDKHQVIINGAQAVALGAIAGGCNFVSSYPMSPSTAVLAFLAQNASKFGIVAEQAEDEIAAVNMAIGAWYAGARAMVTTSGGGFALMTEGVSLAGMMESPLVVHLAQRPGPATGLPTRTEQADLELALYAGHGEFPRIILAPGTLEEGFQLTCKAFELADKFQVPVFILTDQYFMDSYYNTNAFDVSLRKTKKYFIKTPKNYKRYELTENGISPRGIPGYGKGLVCTDSDEHDEQGHITEDLDLRIEMVDKRLKKLDLIKEEIISPEIIGPEKYKNLIICWGSTRNIVCEAVDNLDRKDTAVLHFKQVHPLHDSAWRYIKRAKKTVAVESNATGQFTRLLKINTGIDIDKIILKYSGLSFAADELAEKLADIL